ncbi:MAG TPA: response regulator [Methanocorpusculum sp.]|nr:response regulator [Methanocorpusculum sp.]
MAEIKKRILAVDDDSMTHTLVESALSSEYEVIISENAKNALMIMKTVVPDLILLDLNMPEMNGTAMYSILRSDEIFCKIPVIFLTGETDSSTEEKLLLEGGYDYIRKPSPPGILAARVKNALTHANPHQLKNPQTKSKKNFIRTKKTVSAYLRTYRDEGNSPYFRSKNVAAALNISSCLASRCIRELAENPETDLHIIRWKESNGVVWKILSDENKFKNKK